MPERVVDLRSDTLTLPSEPMRAAMAAAEVGDDHYGEDPTVRRLEETAADLFGREAAVFVPTGTMGNFVSLASLAPPGSEVLADEDAHVVTYEMGGLALLGGVATRTLSSTAGVFGARERAGRLRLDPGGARPSGDPYSRVATSAVAIENTHVFSGGRAWTLRQIDEVAGAVRGRGAALHCDGARIWNAHVATGVALADFGRRFDTLSVCLSKGLGAPVGSLVICDAAREEAVRDWRRRLGGSMRQSGILAAAGLYALAHHIDRLADDHARARHLAERLATVDPAPLEAAMGADVLPETNIVLLALPDADGFAAAAANAGVRLHALRPDLVRIVTHLDIDDEALDQAAHVLARLLSGWGRLGDGASGREASSRTC